MKADQTSVSASVVYRNIHRLTQSEHHASNASHGTESSLPQNCEVTKAGAKSDARDASSGVGSA